MYPTVTDSIIPWNRTAYKRRTLLELCADALFVVRHPKSTLLLRPAFRDGMAKPIMVSAELAGASSEPSKLQLTLNNSIWVRAFKLGRWCSLLQAALHKFSSESKLASSANTRYADHYK